MSYMPRGEKKNQVSILTVSLISGINFSSRPL